MKVVKGLRNKSYKGKFKQRNRIISQEKGLTVPTVQEPYRKIMTHCSLDRSWFAEKQEILSAFFSVGAEMFNHLHNSLSHKNVKVEQINSDFFYYYLQRRIWPPGSISANVFGQVLHRDSD